MKNNIPISAVKNILEMNDEDFEKIGIKELNKYIREKKTLALLTGEPRGSKTTNRRRIS